MAENICNTSLDSHYEANIKKNYFETPIYAEKTS